MGQDVLMLQGECISSTWDRGMNLEALKTGTQKCRGGLPGILSRLWIGRVRSRFIAEGVASALERLDFYLLIVFLSCLSQTFHVIRRHPFIGGCLDIE